MTDLVTGEAVVLELRLAKLASRLLALLIDLAGQLLLLVIGLLVIGGVADSVDVAASAAIVLVFLVAVVIGYPVAFETLTRGRTLGKMALGLRVVREDGGPIRFRHAFVRGLLAVVEIWLTSGAVALVVSLASSKGKRLGDFLAGTIVVRERVPATKTSWIVMPPSLAGWASSTDLARLPDDLALAARQFLGRSGELAPEVRASMGTRLASAVAACISPPPPAGVPPSTFLAAVLAERRRRETVRLDQGAAAQTGAAPPGPYGVRPQLPAAPAAPPDHGMPHRADSHGANGHGADSHGDDPHGDNPYAPPQ